VVGVDTSTCGDIYRHALKNATAKRLQTQSSKGIEEGTGSSGGEGVHKHNDIFLRSIDAELDDFYQSVTMPAGCEYLQLDASARSGRAQVVPKAEKDRLNTTIRQSWATQDMSLVESQLETGLGHVSKATILQVFNSQGMKA
jgi:hypothetical protein